MTDPAIGYTVAVEILDAELCTGTPGNVVLEQSILPGEAKQKQNIVLYVECIGGIDPENPDPLAPGEETMEPAPPRNRLPRASQPLGRGAWPFLALPQALEIQANLPAWCSPPLS